MKGFLGKLFGSNEKDPEGSGPTELVADVLETVLNAASLELSFDVVVDSDSNDINVEFYGDDEGLLLNKDGQLLDAFQLYIKRVVQHQYPEDKINVSLDCDNFKERMNKSLIKLADKLKGIALDKGKVVYFRALPPRKRRIVHQYIAEDTRVNSHSVGDGFFKKIKIFPADKSAKTSGDVGIEA